MPRTMSSPRILIVRLSAIGDVIQSMPIACALRRRFPDALVTWVVESRSAELLQNHPALDEVLTVPRGWLKSPKTLWRLRRQLRERRFDIALEAQGLTKAALLARLSGAPRRLGFGPPWGRELSPWLNTESVETPGPHVVQRNLQLLRPLGIESPEVEFLVPERSEDARTAERMVGEFQVERGFALINVGAGWPSKLWSADRYGAVAAHLGAVHQLPTLVLWAGADERAMADRVVADSQGRARLAPKTTLSELAALARRAKLFLGSDTGPLHLAEAVGTPCVGLYGPWPKDIHGPYGPQHIAIQKAFFKGSTRERRTAPPTLMAAITTADVCEACDRILSR
ncbi:MAG: glycosyltransferase family 9 protein [Thermoguttaceae bacterium]